MTYLMFMASIWLAIHAYLSLATAIRIARDLDFDDGGIVTAALTVLMTPVSVLALRVLWEGPLC